MKLFEKVHCKAYMRKISDGVYIQLFNADGTFCDTNTVKDYNAKAIAYRLKINEQTHLNEEEEIADLSEFCCQTVEKTYRERTECEFDGFLVGFTTIKCAGLIGTDWVDDSYYPEYGYCFKETTYAPKVGVVYFKNNCKRYVLPEDMEIIE